MNTLAKQPLSLSRLELIEVALPQVESFRSAVGERLERRALFVRWWDGDGAWGIGECSCRPDPFYSHEFNSAAVEMVRDHALPLLKSLESIDDLEHALARIRGWPFTRAALLDAAFDLQRRRGGKDPLDLRDHCTRRVPAGISLGIFDSAEAAVDRVGEALGKSYHRIKMKVSSDMDTGPLQAVRDAFPDAPLAFDANGSLDSTDITGLLAELAALSPLMVEQPFPPSRLDWCALAKAETPGLRIALDESINDLGDLEIAHNLGACDEINIKPGRVGGQNAALAILDRCRHLELPAWIGGMFETGIGRFANLRMAARIDGALAHDLSPSRRYFTRDVVVESIDMDTEGFIALGSERPVKVDDAALDELTIQRWELPTQ